MASERSLSWASLALTNQGGFTHDYWVMQRVVVVTLVTSPLSALASPITSVLSMVWQFVSGGGGGVTGGGGGGLAQAPRRAAQRMSGSAAQMRFPRLFIG